MNFNKTYPKITFLLFLISFSFLKAQWIRSNSPMSKGREKVYDICIKDSKVYIGTDNGISVSEDFGASWKDMNPQVPPSGTFYNISYKVPSLSANQDYLFAANMDFYSYSEGDESWTKIINKPMLSEWNSINAYEDWIIAGNSASGMIYNSTDGGLNWETNSGAGQEYCCVMKDSIGFLASYRIMRTSDYGATWYRVFGATRKNPHYGSLYFKAITLKNNFVYAGMGNTVFISNDTGLTWSDSTDLNCISINDIVTVSSVSEINYIFAATDSGVYRSSDNGKQWEEVNSGLSVKLLFSLAYQKNGFDGKPTLYTGGVGGIFRSTDFGESWSTISPCYITSLTSMGDNIFAGGSFLLYDEYQGCDMYKNSFFNGTSHSEVYYSPDGGVNWSEADFGISDSGFTVLNSLAANESSNNNYNLFAGMSSYIVGDNGGLFASKDYGKNWTSIFTDQAAGHKPKLGISHSGLFLGTLGYGTFRSINYDENWEQINSGATVSSDSLSSPAYLTCFSFDGDKIYAGSSQSYVRTGDQPWIIENLLINNVYFSNNNGTTWENLELEMPDELKLNAKLAPTLSCISVSGDNLIVGMDKNHRIDIETTGGGIYHFVNNGDKWVLADTVLTNVEIVALEEYEGTLIAATLDKGIYRSFNNGADWSEFNSGLEDLKILSTVISNTYLYAGTYNGLWKRPLSEITSIKNEQIEYIPNEFILGQNYPNPFNPTTKISYSVAKSSHIKIKVFDILGREIITLVNEEKPIGNYEIEFDGSNLATGIYLYTLQAEGFSKTRKLVLLK